MDIEAPDNPDHGDTIRLSDEEETELASLLDDLFENVSQDEVEITSANFAPDGTSYKHHVILDLANGDTYGLRPLSEARDADLASEILAKAHVPNYSPFHEARSPGFLDRLPSEIVVYRWVRGDPKTWKEADVGQDIVKNRDDFLVDFGSWVCVGPVLALSDANNQGNFVWDMEGKGFARVDFQDVFQGPQTVQGMLVVLGWIPEDILTRDQILDAINLLTQDEVSLEEAIGGGDSHRIAELDDTGVRSFIESFIRTHRRLRATANAWLPQVQAQVPDSASQEIESWVESDAKTKMEEVAESLPEEG